MSGKLKHFGRKLTLDNPEFQPVAGDEGELLHVGPDRAGLPADRRPDRGPAPDRRSARRSTGPATHYPEYLPARDPRRASGSCAIARALEEAHYPATFEGRDAALRRLAFDELLALQLGMVGRRRQRGRDAAPADRRSTTRPTRASARRSSASIGARSSAAPVDLTADQDAAIDAIRDDLARADADAPAPPGRRRLGQDRGRGLGARGRRAGPGCQGALLAPTDLLARQHHRDARRAARGRSAIAGRRC